MKAILVLEDGSVFEGKSFGADGEVIGEVVFNTGMTGYQEVLTDPSYCGQVVTMTYPLIGNYGINYEDLESQKPQVKGFIVREFCKEPSNWRSMESIDEYFKKNKVIGIEGIDTRLLTRILREKGTMKGIITNQSDFSIEKRMDEIRAFQIKNPVYEVTTKKILNYKSTGNGDSKYKVALLDYGIKQNIVRSLVKRDCDVTVYPAWTKAEEILSDEPDGIMLSNGPGDPKDCAEPIQTIKELMGIKPIFGICLGHQLTALASNSDTERLKYGHRGGNHPVKDLRKNLTYITSQNHGYTIVEETMDPNCMEVSHRNMNDGTVEGVRYKDKPVFTVQFHPEASPGPTDTAYLFDEFISLMDKCKEVSK